MVSVGVIMMMLMIVVVVMIVVMAVMVFMIVVVVMMVFMIVVMMVFMIVVVVMMVFMIVVVVMMVLCVAQEVSLLDTVDFYMHVGAGDAAPDTRSSFESDARNTDRVQLPHTFFFIRNNFQQGCREHIARSSHAAFKI